MPSNEIKNEIDTHMQSQGNTLNSYKNLSFQKSRYLS